MDKYDRFVLYFCFGAILAHIFIGPLIMKVLT
jgi:hypothetical protein